MPKNRNVKAGFTLVELLVVIAIIGILIGMLLPAVQQVRAAARRMACANQQRQMALAALNYESAYQRFPPGSMHAGKGNSRPNTDPGWGWKALILPFMEQNALADLFDFNLMLRDPNHVNLLTTEVPTFFCPSDEELRDRGINMGGGVYVSRTNYVGNGGSFLNSFAPLPDGRYNCVLGRTEDDTYQGRTMGDMVDGTSNTFFCGEVLKYNFQWDGSAFGFMNKRNRVGTTLGQARTGDGFLNPPDETSVAIKRNSFSSNHQGGMNFVYCDGSTHFVPDTIQHNRMSWRAYQANPNDLGVFQRVMGIDEGLIFGTF
jgi:prepilin-type N-terminal cleavage/methylation domain-containing protein/prepilin-type processing-associated H-X9-DG protein